MATFNNYREQYDDSDYDDSFGFCYHGYKDGDCQECDDVGDIDKCLNCGRYKSSELLNKDQVCSKGCRNPNEY